MGCQPHKHNNTVSFQYKENNKKKSIARTSNKLLSVGLMTFDINGRCNLIYNACQISWNYSNCDGNIAM